MEIPVKLNLCFSTLAPDKQDDRWDQRGAVKEENFNEVRQSVRSVYLQWGKVSGWVVGRKWEAVYYISSLFTCWSPKG